MKLELRDIEYFAVVAEHGHVGRAAEALGLSQPALSKSLRRLEQSLQARLVKRTPKGVDLTSVGAALSQRLRGLRLSLEDIVHEADDLSQGRAGHLRVGAAESTVINLLPAACAALRKEAPGVTMEVLVGGRNTALPDRVRSGELDLAINAIEVSRYADLTEEQLYDQEYLVYAAASHKLARRRQLTLADLVPEQWVLALVGGLTERELSQAFIDRSLPPPRIAIQTTALPLRQQLAAHSNLLAFGPREVLRDTAFRFSIVELRIKDLAYTRRLSVFYRKDAYLSPAARRFIEILKTTAKEIANERT